MWVQVKGGSIMPKELNKMELLKQITALNFVIEDLSLTLTQWMEKLLQSITAV